MTLPVQLVWIFIVILFVVVLVLLQETITLRRKLTIYHYLSQKPAGHLPMAGPFETRHAFLFLTYTDPDNKRHIDFVANEHQDCRLTVIYNAPRWKCNVLAKQLPDKASLWPDEEGRMHKHMGVTSMPSVVLFDALDNTLRTRALSEP